MEKLKGNKYIVLIVLVVFCLGFYWYSYRPEQVKKECYRQAHNLGVFSEELEALKMGKSVEEFQAYRYQDCLSASGLK